ncbi:MAG: hypothetical protein ACFFCM_13720, partial [Promethearchaeota archaeon]
MTEIEECIDKIKENYPNFTFLKDNRFIHLDKYKNERFNLKFQDLYSKRILTEYNRLIDAITSYLLGESISIVSKKYKISLDSLRTYSKHLLNGKDMSFILKMNIGYQGQLGLDIAIAEMRIFKKKNKRLPKQREMNAILKCIYKKHYWINLGVKTWNDIMRKVFSEVNSDNTRLEGKLGLEKAKKKIILYKKKYGKNPVANVKEMNQFVNAISRKFWIDFGINTWNDLLIYAIDDINKINGIYSGKEGLLRAKNEIKLFEEVFNRKPKANDNHMSSIATAIKRKYWIKYNINSWNGLIKDIFGKPNKTYGIWTGKNG